MKRSRKATRTRLVPVPDTVDAAYLGGRFMDNEGGKGISEDKDQIENGSGEHAENKQTSGERKGWAVAR